MYFSTYMAPSPKALRASRDADSNADNLKDEAQEKLIKHIEDGNPVLCCARPGEEGLISGDSAAFKDVLMAVQEAANPRSRSRSLSLSSDDDGE